MDHRSQLFSCLQLHFCANQIIFLILIKIHQNSTKLSPLPVRRGGPSGGAGGVATHRNQLARPSSLEGGGVYNRLRQSKFSWFSYYQRDNEDYEGDTGEYSGVEDDHYMSPVTQESQLTLSPGSPLEDRVMSPCSELDLDPGKNDYNNIFSTLKLMHDDL